MWEVIGVVKKLDQDTFAQKPERQTEAGERMVKIGKVFRDSGIYVAQRLDDIDQGKPLAKALAEEFYQYGSSIIEEQRSDQVLSLSEIASQELTSEQLEAVDRFLAGDKLYESRRARVEQKLINFPNKEKQKFYEDQRRHTLKQFFRVVEKAFKLHAKDQAEGLRNSVNILQLWRQNTPVHESFLRKVNQSIMTEIDTPSQEINAAVFRRGLERLLREFEAPESFQEAEKAIGNTNKIFNKAEKVMKLLGDLLGFESNSNSVAERKKLIDVLDIDGMKAELEALRQTGDLEKISQAERQMTDQIQEVVSAFSYKASISSPSKMLATKTRNCVGAWVLGGALMKEVGLNYLVGTVPEHSILFLVTSDGNVEWRDMQNSDLNEDLTDGMIKEQLSDGRLVTVEDIVKFSQSSDKTKTGLGINLDKGLNNKILRSKEDKMFVELMRPEDGQRAQILVNLGVSLIELSRTGLARKVFTEALKVNQNDSSSYVNLGFCFELEKDF